MLGRVGDCKGGFLCKFFNRPFSLAENIQKLQPFRAWNSLADPWKLFVYFIFKSSVRVHRPYPINYSINLLSTKIITKKNHCQTKFSGALFFLVRLSFSLNAMSRVQCSEFSTPPVFSYCSKFPGITIQAWNEETFLLAVFIFQMEIKKIRGQGIMSSINKGQKQTHIFLFELLYVVFLYKDQFQ